MPNKNSDDAGKAQDTTYNILIFPQRRLTKADALANYARASSTAGRFSALVQLVDARLIEQGETI